MFNDLEKLMIARVQTLAREGFTPANILHVLRAEGLDREIADYLYWALGLDPDAVTYIYSNPKLYVDFLWRTVCARGAVLALTTLGLLYAWLHGSISDDQLNTWIVPMIDPPLALCSIANLKWLWIFVAHKVEGGGKRRPYHRCTFNTLGLLYVLCTLLYVLCTLLYVLCSMFYALCSMLSSPNTPASPRPTATAPAPIALKNGRG